MKYEPSKRMRLTMFISMLMILLTVIGYVSYLFISDEIVIINNHSEEFNNNKSIFEFDDEYGINSSSDVNKIVIINTDEM